MCVSRLYNESCEEPLPLQRGPVLCCTLDNIPLIRSVISPLHSGFNHFANRCCVFTCYVTIAAVLLPERDLQLTKQWHSVDFESLPSVSVPTNPLKLDRSHNVRTARIECCSLRFPPSRFLFALLGLVSFQPLF